jgi:hypothetical protein
MNKRTSTSILALTIALAALILVNSRAEERVAAHPAASYTLASLPASDAVIYVDAQRLLTDSIPGVLVNSPKLLAHVNEELDRFKERTNIDLRSFDSVAIGLRFNPPSKGQELRVVILAQGRFDASTVLDAVLARAKRDGLQPQERTVDGRTLYVLSPRKQDAEQTEATTDKQEAPHGHDMAFAVVDANTFACGDFESVRAALDISTERASDELVQLATRTPGAVVGFSGNVPSFFTEQLAKDKETIAKNFAAVRQFYGFVTTTASDAETSITLRAETPDQAREISKAVNALKTLASFAPKKPSMGDMRPLPELIKALTVTNEGNEVFLNLKLTQAEIASLVRNF